VGLLLRTDQTRRAGPETDSRRCPTRSRSSRADHQYSCARAQSRHDSRIPSAARSRGGGGGAGHGRRPTCPAYIRGHSTDFNDERSAHRVIAQELIESAHAGAAHPNGQRAAKSCRGAAARSWSSETEIYKAKAAARRLKLARKCRMPGRGAPDLANFPERIALGSKFAGSTIQLAEPTRRAPT